jgi:hypothetical protein
VYDFNPVEATSSDPEDTKDVTVDFVITKELWK